VLPSLQEAHEDHEEQVAALFTECGLAPPTDLWKSRIGPNAHAGLRATPFVATQAGRVTAFVLERQSLFWLDREPIECTQLEGFIAAPDGGGDQGARTLLEELPRRTRVAFAARWSTEGIRLLRQYHWRLASRYSRLLIKPKRRIMGVDRTLASPDPDANRAYRRARIEAGFSLFTPRPGKPLPPLAAAYSLPGGGWVRLVDGPDGELLLDGVAGEPEAAAERITALADTLLRPAYLSFLSEPLRAAFVAQRRATPLPPLWGLFTCVGSVESRELVRQLSGDVRFEIFPDDL
jgi:hypothetical protein